MLNIHSIFLLYEEKGFVVTPFRNGFCLSSTSLHIVSAYNNRNTNNVESVSYCVYKRGSGLLGCIEKATKIIDDFEKELTLL